jgi:hypothetical protein
MFRMEEPSYWALTRRADIACVSQHPELFTSAQGVALDPMPAEIQRPVLLLGEPGRGGVRRSGQVQSATLIQSASRLRRRRAALLSWQPAGQGRAAKPVPRVAGSAADGRVRGNPTRCTAALSTASSAFRRSSIRRDHAGRSRPRQMHRTRDLRIDRRRRVFEVQDDGTVLIHENERPESDRDRVQQAVMQCPAAALRLVD